MTPYQSHRRKWLGCRRCLLCDQRRRVCLARGKLPAPVLMIGESPGASEDIIGKPFVGPAGHLLDRIIEAAMPDGPSYAITNLVACFPRVAKAARVNEPPDEAIKACAPRLREVLDLCRPRLVVAVGNLAKKWIPKVLPGGPSVLETSLVHPAAILRADISQRGLLIQRSIVTLADAVSEL